MSNFEAYLTAHQTLVLFWTSITSALVTLGAVVVAWRTAASTRDTVQEMRETRLQAVRPVLYLSARTHNMRVVYTRDIVFPEVKFGTSKLVVDTPFELTNAVDAPAFDISCEWSLDEAASLPTGFKLVTLQHVATARKDVVEYAEGKVTIRDPAFTDDNPFATWDEEYNRESKTTHFELLGKQKKGLNFPARLAAQLAFLAMYNVEQKQLYKVDAESPSIKLIVKVTCASPNGETVSRQFGFRLSLWSFGEFSRGENERIERGHLPSDWTQVEVMGNMSPIPPEQMPAPIVKKPPGQKSWGARFLELATSLVERAVVR